MENTATSPRPNSDRYRPVISSASKDTNPCRLKYSVGVMVSPAPWFMPMSSSCSSMRHSSHGSQEQLPSRKPILRLGNRSITPPPMVSTTLIIISMGWLQTWYMA